MYFWSEAMSPGVQTISIVCPAYQEEEVLPLFHRELTAVLRQVEESYDTEVLYVDDGSRDRTLSVIRELASQDRRGRFFFFLRNFCSSGGFPPALVSTSFVC